eukprot:gene1727-2329_t
MTKTITRPWDPAAARCSAGSQGRVIVFDAQAAYLDAAMEDGDPAVITAALGDIARARGMSDMARATGLSRESLYKALSQDGNPEFATVLKSIEETCTAGTCLRSHQRFELLDQPGDV